MSTVHNTAYSTKVDDMPDSELSNCNIENGALVRTSTGLYMGHGSSNVKIYPQLGGGIDRKVETISADKTLGKDDHVIFVNATSDVDITLPLAATYAGKEYIIRVRKNSSDASLIRSGSDKIDDGSLDNSIDIDESKSRTVISDGISTWYCVDNIGQ